MLQAMPGSSVNIEWLDMKHEVFRDKYFHSRVTSQRNT
jgi:hypothetical protein